MIRTPFILAATTLLLWLTGCCGARRPSTDQVQKWVTQEVPAGSSEADVQSFARRHQFRYERDAPTYGQAYRAMEGCDWMKPIVQVEVTFDEAGRVESTAVRSFSEGLP